MLYFEELRCYRVGCEVADSTRWCRSVGRGASRWSRRGLTQPLFWSREFTTLEQIFFELSQGQCGAYVWLWRGRTSPYQRGCSVVLWPHPHDRVVVALRNGSSVSKWPSTTRSRAYGPAPAAPAEIAERQSRPPMHYLWRSQGKCSFPCKFLHNFRKHFFKL